MPCFLGYTASETIGQPVTMLIPPDRPDEEPRILEQIRRGGIRAIVIEGARLQIALGFQELAIPEVRQRGRVVPGRQYRAAEPE